jgi:hypothetical protein
LKTTAEGVTEDTQVKREPTGEVKTVIATTNADGEVTLVEENVSANGDVIKATNLPDGTMIEEKVITDSTGA